MRNVIVRRAILALVPALLLAGCSGKSDESPTAVPPPSTHAVPLAPVAGKHLMGGNGRMGNGGGGGMNMKTAPGGN